MSEDQSKTGEPRLPRWEIEYTDGLLARRSLTRKKIMRYAEDNDLTPAEALVKIVELAKI